MNQHTLRSYDKQLTELTDSMLEMGRLVKELIRLACRALTERDPDLIEVAMNNDKQINALDRKIEEQATVVLALQNPMAVDLRFVTSALKISGALERAGDLAKNTVKRSVKIAAPVPPKTMEKMKHMVDIVVSMVDDALASIESRNPDKATAVWQRDDSVDDMYHDILTNMQEEMTQNPSNILSYTHLVFAAKNFERIADYATSLAKTVHYVTSGTPPDKSLLRAAIEHNAKPANH